VRTSQLERQIAAVATLAEPIRRDLYLYVAKRRTDVGRDEAARALRISRALAAFHLDKLAKEGLLEISYRRLSGRRGPGAGRPAKLYRRAACQLDVTLPRRRYELAGRVLARALAAVPARVTSRLLDRVAGETGRRLGAAARTAARGRARRTGALARTLAVLDDWGYDPARENGTVRLRNCPFEALANECRPLVCGMNLSLVRGLLQGLGTRALRAQLRPEPGSCCVVLRRVSRPTPSP
jgi:predicted ArsR family transcriptional regulator